MNDHRHSILLALLLLPTVGVALPTQAQTILQANSAMAGAGSMSAPVVHRLQISSGDLLDVNVFDTPDLSGKLRVDERGYIALPLAGELQVIGLTAEEAAHKIETLLQETDILKDPHVSVAVLEYATQGITIMGEVRNPGVYPLVGARGLLDLISEAGGLSSQAGRAVTITHRDDPGHPVTTKINGTSGTSPEANVDIRPGDTIVVLHAGLVYVIGAVGKPGGFLLENSDQLNVLQAIALAEGTSKTASLDHAKIIRKAGNGEQEVPLSLKKILANKAPDEPLYDGDVLFVPSSAAKDAIRDVLPAVAGAAIFRIP